MNRRVTVMLCLWFATLAIGWAHQATADNWPQWRGARLDGISTEKKIPTEWSQEKNVAWRLPLPGPAGSTPVVWDDHIFLTSADGQELVLMAVTTSGKPLWRQKLGTGNQVVRGDEGNSASPSPCTDGKHVWALIGTGELACFDFQGKEIWETSLADRYGPLEIQFGYASTPVLDGGRLYLQIMHSGGAYVVALDKLTGREIWKHNRQSDARDECEHSYASPVLYRDDEQEFLLTHGADYIVAHSLEDGAELWRQGGLNPPGNYNNTLRFVASPVAVPGLIVVPSAKNGPVLGLRPDGTRAWTRPQNTPDVPSPLVHGGLVYLCRENGNLIVLDAKTGEEYYETRTHADRHRASPMYADGHVYLTARDGTITVVKAGKEFEQVASNTLNENMSSSPVVADGTLYLRTFEALYAIRHDGK